MQHKTLRLHFVHLLKLTTDNLVALRRLFHLTKVEIWKFNEYSKFVFAVNEIA